MNEITKIADQISQLHIPNFGSLNEEGRHSLLKDRLAKVVPEVNYLGHLHDITGIVVSWSEPEGKIEHTTTISQAGLVRNYR